MKARERLKEVRKGRGMNQTQLGHLVGMSAEQISRMENGKQGISTEFLEDLCPKLGISVAEFYGASAAERERAAMDPAILRYVVHGLKNSDLLNAAEDVDALADATWMLYTLAEGMVEAGTPETRIMKEVAADAPKMLRLAVQQGRRRS
jgi:transcriptional regulator with XRE-family HTH domain